MDKPTLPEVRDRRAEVAVRAMTRGGESRTGYRVRVSSTQADVRAAQSLRFQVFNLELNEGLESSYATLRDEDPFDPVCDHLLVEDESSGEVVGTYRLQTGTMALANLGFYSAQEFEFGAFRDVYGEMVELGRACVHRSHRNLQVLTLLWRGIRVRPRAWLPLPDRMQFADVAGSAGWCRGVSGVGTGLLGGCAIPDAPHPAICVSSRRSGRRCEKNPPSVTCLPLVGCPHLRCAGVGWLVQNH
jgi:hypothetical protein